MESFDFGGLFLCLGALLMWTSPLWLLKIAADVPSRKWRKPRAYVSGFDTIHVEGDVREIQMLGVPGAEVWTHVEPFKWEVKIGRGVSTQDAMTTINTWDGRMS